ncbi:hypothetical protein LP420_15850 [Massilia sp. B-10]|nr:hypothetical protein LP420_15850 [Massilia sp. B-10]
MRAAAADRRVLVQLLGRVEVLIDDGQNASGQRLDVGILGALVGLA